VADAIIAASARSPIGRAGKGSLKDLRPDDLTSMVVRALLENVGLVTMCVGGGQGMAMILERLT
jgi:acetyl-CoA acetyltransferase